MFALFAAAKDEGGLGIVGMLMIMAFIYWNCARYERKQHNRR